MRKLSVMLLLVMPAIAQAQNYPGMSEADMRKIQKMQSCIEKIDQKQFQSIEQSQMRFVTEMKSLCQSGQRDEAQKKAIAFEKEMTKNPAIVAMKKCGEIAKEMMSDMTFMNHEEGDSSLHVCDSI